MNIQEQPTVHATAVTVGKHGILIRGAAGSGKSSLAMALIDDPRLQARLVGDDRVILVATADSVVARVPAPIAGRIELRGIGIVDMPFVEEAAIALVVDLLPPESCPRLPDEGERTASLLGRTVPRLALPIGLGDGVLRVRMALKAWIGAA